MWRIPEAQLRALGQVRGRVVLELGCGGGQGALALRRAGARVVGLDISAAQLGHARDLAGRRPLRLVQASVEAVPLAAASVDVVVSDHGAIGFGHPEAVLAEVARVLRPGGRLAFCVSSPLRLAASDRAWVVTTALRRPMFGDEPLDDGESVEFLLRHGQWIELLTRHGFALRALHELRPPADATTSFDWFVGREWARRWPAEDVWVADRVG